MWVLPPSPDAKEHALPIVAGAMKVQTDGEKGADASKALLQSLEYGFQVARISLQRQAQGSNRPA